MQMIKWFRILPANHCFYFMWIGWVKSFAIFWWHEAQFSNFCQSCVGDEPHWTVRCWAYWYFQSATHRMFQNELNLPTRLCLIFEVLATRATFLQPSGYSIMINCAFTFRTTNILGYFCGVRVEFELVKHNFPNQTTLHVDLCDFQIPYGVKKCSMCQHTNYHDTTNHNGSLPWTELLWSSD